MPTATPRKRPESKPFHVFTARDKSGNFVGYDIYLNNAPFLVNGGSYGTSGRKMKRHQAYAIARLLNAEKSVRKWAEKFDDPYV